MKEQALDINKQIEQQVTSGRGFKPNLSHDGETGLDVQMRLGQMEIIGKNDPTVVRVLSHIFSIRRRRSDALKAIGLEDQPPVTLEEFPLGGVGRVMDAVLASEVKDQELKLYEGIVDRALLSHLRTETPLGHTPVQSFRELNSKKDMIYSLNLPNKISLI